MRYYDELNNVLMCGISGYYDPHGRYAPAVLSTAVEQMNVVLRHRGPDDSGLWADEDAGIFFGHTRLAIVDTSPLGAQPMMSNSGRYVLVFNGEIYNHRQLRAELEREASAFHGHSDTEVLLNAIEQWGLKKALQRSHVMFALALWDRRNRCLRLARDRLGEKPLYYGNLNGLFMFGSELKALKCAPNWRGDIDRHSLGMFFRHNYVPTPRSIYQNIHKMPSATILSFDSSLNSPSLISYWGAAEEVQRNYATFKGCNEAEVLQVFEQIFTDVLADQMSADVPLGAFLSGGIDSSSVVTAMQRQSSQPVKTFTVGFHEAGYDEALAARKIANYLGTDHTEIYVSSEDAQTIVPKLPQLYDEPFADSSQIPTHLVAQIARQHVAVALSGDGGDELFGGYSRYFLGKRLWKALNTIPSGLKPMLARGVHGVSPATWDRIAAVLRPLLPKELANAHAGDRMHKVAGLLEVATEQDFYLDLISHWKNPESIVIGAHNLPSIVRRDWQHAPVSEFVERMMFVDSINYLQDDILVKVDRASMGASLETRVPFLDNRLYEFAWRLPLETKIDDRRGKLLLRKYLAQHLPVELFEQPKTGFGIPLSGWLRGPLREWAEELLTPTKLRASGYLNAKPIRLKWEEHCDGSRDWQYHLWDVLMFQAWFDTHVR